MLSRHRRETSIARPRAMPRGVPKTIPNATGGTYNATFPTSDLAGRSPGGIRRIHPLILIITTGGEQSYPMAFPESRMKSHATRTDR